MTSMTCCDLIVYRRTDSSFGTIDRVSETGEAFVGNTFLIAYRRVLLHIDKPVTTAMSKFYKSRQPQTL